MPHNHRFDIWDQTLYQYHGPGGDIIIPDGVKVIHSTAFLNWRHGFSSRQITTVYIPDSVTDINDFAFSFCQELHSVRLPATLRNIGDSAFSFCKKLRSVTIPNSIYQIGKDAFQYCSALSSVSLPNHVPYLRENAFFGCSGLTDENGFVIINNILYNYYGKDTKVIVPDGVTTISANAFSYSSVDSVILPDSVTIIQADAFNSCENLSFIRLPDSIMEINAKAFYSCSALKAVRLPKNLRKIEKRTFARCSALSSVVFPENLSVIAEGAFENCSSLQNIDLPYSLTFVEDDAFYGCKSLCFHSYPKQICDISPSLISFCSDLADENGFVCLYNTLFYYNGTTGDVVIPDYIENIESHAFENNAHIASVRFGNRIKVIPSDCFYHCSHLTHIEIPDTVENISPFAFSKCERLNNISLGETIARKLGLGLLLTIFGTEALCISFLRCPSAGTRLYESFLSDYIKKHLLHFAEIFILDDDVSTLAQLLYFVPNIPSEILDTCFAIAEQHSCLSVRMFLLEYKNK